MVQQYTEDLQDSIRITLKKREADAAELRKKHFKHIGMALIDELVFYPVPLPESIPEARENKNEYVPSQEDIKKSCQKIQKKWTELEKTTRTVIKKQELEVMKFQATFYGRVRQRNYRKESDE